MLIKTKDNETIDFKYNLSEYWSLLKKYKFLLVVTFILALAVTALGIIDKFLFKIIVDRGTEFTQGTLLQNEFVHILLIIALVFVGVIITRPICEFFKVRSSSFLEARLIRDLKEKYFNHITRLAHKFHTTHKTGSLISRMNRGSSAIEVMTDVIIFQFTPLIFNLSLVVFSLAYFSIMPAVILFLTTVVFVSYSWIIQYIQQDSKIKFNCARDNEKGFISDVFTNIDSIKYFGKEKYVGKIFNKITNGVKDKTLKYWSYFWWFESGHIFILGVGVFFLIYFPVMQLLNGEISVGTLVFIFTIYGNVVGPMFMFVWGMRSFYRAMADFQDLFKYGKISNEIKDKKNARNLEIKKGKLEFRNVSFSYNKKRAFSLDDFNLVINSNEKVAFVGHSGCGKTTLVKLLYRLFDVQKGEILIDDKNIQDVRQESLRNELSIVPQECILFDDTIFNNIKFSRPSASRKEVWNAIKFAQLDKFVMNLPLKGETIVGERGVKLSGGEKQRVSIARAILANKKILVLDEATSALDSETEYEIQKDLWKLLKNRTSIIIAHRLSTIMNADRIIVMKDGKIIQQGKHSELINQAGEYKKLWNLQKGGYIR